MRARCGVGLEFVIRYLVANKRIMIPGMTIMHYVFEVFCFQRDD